MNFLLFLLFLTVGVLSGAAAFAALSAAKNMPSLSATNCSTTSSLSFSSEISLFLLRFSLSRALSLDFNPLIAVYFEIVDSLNVLV